MPDRDQDKRDLIDSLKHDLEDSSHKRTSKFIALYEVRTVVTNDIAAVMEAAEKASYSLVSHTTSSNGQYGTVSHYLVFRRNSGG